MIKNHGVMVSFLMVPSLALGLMPERTLGQPDDQNALVWSTPSEALAGAEQSGRAILLYVNSPSCGPCKRMEREVFPEVQPLLDRLEKATLNLDDNESSELLFDQRRTPLDWATFFGIDRTPGWVMLSSAGTPVATAIGFLDTHAFGLLLAYGSTGAHKHVTFKEYAEQTGN